MENSKYKSVGVTAIEEEIVVLCGPKSAPNDAGLSTIDKITPKVSESSTDHYYYMKINDTKDQKKHPCRIEFQMVNSGIQKELRNNCKCCQHRYEAADVQMKNNFGMQFEPTIQYCGHAERDESHQGRKMFGECFASLCNCDQVSEVGSCDGDVEAQKTSKQKVDFTYDPQESKTNKAAQAVFEGAEKFWAEVFGLINILIAIPLAFILQVFWFVLHSMLRSVVVGFVQMIIEIIIIPILSLIKNVLETFCGIFEPAVRLFSELVKPIAECLRAIRLADVNVNKFSDEYRKHPEDVV